MADPLAVQRMVNTRKLCTLRGGVASGRRAHFNFANARYSAEWLCLRSDLLGKDFWLIVDNEDDARFVSVSTQQGLVLGVVRAGPPWHRTPHSLYVRQAIRVLDKRRLLHLSENCDAVEALIRYAESSPGHKLPVHPAYLEARRILQAHAESITGQSTVRFAKATIPASQSATACANDDINIASSPTEGSLGNDRLMPPMRKAQQW